MSPTSYRTAPPRVNKRVILPSGRHPVNAPHTKSACLGELETAEVQQQLDAGGLVVGVRGGATRARLPFRRGGNRRVAPAGDFRRDVAHLLAVHEHRDRLAKILIPRLGLKGRPERRREPSDALEVRDAGDDGNALQNRLCHRPIISRAGPGASQQKGLEVARGLRAERRYRSLIGRALTPSSQARLQSSCDDDFDRSITRAPRCIKPPSGVAAGANGDGVLHGASDVHLAQSRQHRHQFLDVNIERAGL